MTDAPQARRTVDIAIIGGGIAGSSLAITLQREGLSTILVEREPVFRDRVRGEACHPWGVAEMDALGLRPLLERAGGIDLPRWSIYRDAELADEMVWSEAFPGVAPEIGFNHPRLQETLLSAAGEVGALVRRPAMTHVTQSSDGWSLRVQSEHADEEIAARFLIAADGKTSTTRKAWGAEAIPDPPHHGFAGVLLRGLDLAGNSGHQAWFDGGFTMIFPQGDGYFRAYLVSPLDNQPKGTTSARIATFLDQCARACPAGAFDDVEVAGPLAWFPNSHVRCSRIAGPLAVAIGDAAGAPDPSQGHGMSLVWRDIRVVRDLLRQHDWAEVPALFAGQREHYGEVLRQHARWIAPLTTDVGPAAAALKAQVDRAREADPSAEGYAAIFGLGPDGLSVSPETRSRFLGEHLTSTPVLFPDARADAI